MPFPVPLPASNLKEVHEYFSLKLPSVMKMKALRHFTVGVVLSGVVCFIPPDCWSSAPAMKDGWRRKPQLPLESINPGKESWSEGRIMESSCYVLLGAAEGKLLPSYLQLVLTSCISGESMSHFLEQDLPSTPNSI